jgi:hypothetical protein
LIGEIWNVADEHCGGFLTRNGVALTVRMMGWAQADMDNGKPFASDVGDVVRLEWLMPGSHGHLDDRTDQKLKPSLRWTIAAPRCILRISNSGGA